MCFPSKNQKALYSDEATKQQTTPPDTKAPASAVPAPITTPINITSPMAPKVAIVIYSMYGHVVKCSCPISYRLYFDLIHTPSTVAEAEKKGIESAGGSATIYQYAWFIYSHCDLSDHDMIQDSGDPISRNFDQDVCAPQARLSHPCPQRPC